MSLPLIPLPFLPFTRPSINEATIEAVVAVLRSAWITTGPKCKAFEQALSQYFGGRPVRVLANGTATLELALKLAGVVPGDEIITTPLTWVATANVIMRAGAKPVFVDIDPSTRNIDLNKLEAAITPRTRALLPVDLAGLPVDRDRLYAIAYTHNLRVVEDAAQSLGANWRGQAIGSIGDLVSFSFHANKNLTTAEGGCLVLNSEEDAQRLERLRLQGVVRDADGGMDVAEIGIKANLTDIAAVIGIEQLKQLAEFTDKRRALAQHYFKCLNAIQGLGLALPVADFKQSNWHMFQVVLPLEHMVISRGEFIRRMHAIGIGIGVHYPPVHLMTAYRALGYAEGDFPHAERIGRGIVSLPLFPEMAFEDVERVCEGLVSLIAL